MVFGCCNCFFTRTNNYKNKNNCKNNSNTYSGFRCYRAAILLFKHLWFLSCGVVFVLYTIICLLADNICVSTRLLIFVFWSLLCFGEFFFWADTGGICRSGQVFCNSFWISVGLRRLLWTRRGFFCFFFLFLFLFLNFWWAPEITLNSLMLFSQYVGLFL